MHRKISLAGFCMSLLLLGNIASANFIDVPMNHWSYDAVEYLAGKGIVTGMPDGTFQGNTPASRYQMAEFLAKALSEVDMNTASKADVLLLKQLAIEYADELQQLDAKIVDFDDRLRTMERNLGGFKVSGTMIMDWKSAGEMGSPYGNYGKTDVGFNKARILFQKDIDENTRFVTRIGRDKTTNLDGLEFQQMYVEQRFRNNGFLKVGKWSYDWEGNDGSYNDEDAWFTNREMKGFHFGTTFGTADVEIIIAHHDSEEKDYGGVSSLSTLDYLNRGFGNYKGFDEAEYSVYGLRINVPGTEQFGASFNALRYDFENLDTSTGAGSDITNYWISMRYDFNPKVGLKGSYFMQDVTNLNIYDFIGIDGYTVDDSTKAWKIALDLREVFDKRNKAWIEFANMDRGFIMFNNAYGPYGANPNPFMGLFDSTMLFVKLEQQWTETFGSFQRYVSTNYHGTGSYNFDATNWSVGLTYRPSASIVMDLSYDDIRYDGDSKTFFTDLKDDSMIRLRTTVSF